jgi:RraA family protein
MTQKPKSAEIHPGPGFRVRKEIERLSKEIIEQFRLFESPDISDLLNRMYAMSSEIHNVVNNASIAGSACTVKVYPGDNLMVHKALSVAEPGDVLVVDCSGSFANAVVGDLVAQKAKSLGIAGFVIDGMVRDLPAMQEVGLPVYARGVTPVGPLHRGPGEVNHAISCGGIVVNPGDVILGDATGVVVIRREFAEDVLQRAYVQRDALRTYVDSVKRGIFSLDWVDATLAAAGYEDDE